MSAVTITAAPMSVDELLAVVDGATVELAPDALATIEASRAVVSRALASGKPIYGVSTHVGHGKDVRLTQDELRGQQEFLVMTHSGGFGPPLPTALVRAAIAVRLNGIARGGSGASPAAANVLVAMLNAGIHPIVASVTSVGAADLGPMAGIAQVAIGRGTADYGGQTLTGGEALHRAGIAPLVLEPKDGIALISANGVSIGHAALVIARAAEVAAAADVSAALSMEATHANTSIILAVVAAAKPFPGQIEAAAHLRDILAGSHLLDSSAAPSVQDALSFRVVPQVHGALRDYIAYARRAVEVELNSASDNPLVSVPDQAIVSNGNFHPMVLAIAFDALRVAIAHVGQLSERRMSHLWDAFFTLMSGGGPPPNESPPPLFGVQLRYPAAALFPELKQLAAPATLDTPSVDMGVEDHGTSAPLSVRKTEEALGLLDDLLVIELLLARDVLSMMLARPALGSGTAHALQAVEEAIASCEPSPAAVHQAVRATTLDRSGRAGDARPVRDRAATTTCSSGRRTY
ncbi:MAG: aromatic amino acid lyase [Geodermatophilaceae bacterium]|nr:aromatic amino acid lyase [Geodermatophilaceae bacterium]